jgi:tetratricopeptide (TPR) repeat protein
MKPILFVITILVFASNPLIAQNIPVNSRIDMMLIQGNYEDAIDICKQILTYDSLNPEIYYKLGIAYNNILEEDLSISSFHKAVNLNPDNSVYNFMLAKGYYGIGKYKLAEPLLIKVCSLDSMNWVYSYYLTSIYMHYNKYDEAINIYKRFLVKDSTNYDYLNKLAFASLKKGDYEYAADLYNKSLSINKKNLIAIKNLAYLYSAARKADTAIKLLTKGIEIDPSDMDLFAKRAQIYYSRNDNKNALDDYLEILASGDSSAIYLKRAGICYCNTRQFEEAIKYLLLAFKTDTSDYRACSYIGFCYYNLNDMKNSIDYYNRVIKILTPVNTQIGLTHRYIASSQISNGMYKSAINSYLKALDIIGDPNIYMQIANLYDEKLSNKEKAIYYYQKYLENYKNVNIPSESEYIKSIKDRVEYLKNNPAK